jgi:hypothetical protein
MISKSILCCVLALSTCAVAYSQSPSAAPSSDLATKSLVVATQAKSGAEIVVPPADLGPIIVTLRPKQKHEDKPAESDLPAWIQKQAALNGLDSPNLTPWHIRLTYARFDEDGDKVDQGTYEEFWAGPRKYKRIYKGDNLNQTDYVTDRGSFWLGDQRAPDRYESQIVSEVIDPFYYAKTLVNVRVGHIDRVFSGYNFDCVGIEESGNEVGEAAQYCFEPGGSILRYAASPGQTTYNRIVSFQGRNIAQDVDVSHGGKPYLKIRVQTIELISNVNDADFAVPSDAKPQPRRISGILPQIAKNAYPDFPESIRNQHVVVNLEIVVDETGHAIVTKVVDGPEAAQKACEDSVKKTVFVPYMIDGKPVEVETKFQCRLN